MIELSRYRMEQARQCIISAKALVEIENAIKFCDVVDTYLAEK